MRVQLQIPLQANREFAEVFMLTQRVDGAMTRTSPAPKAERQWGASPRTRKRPASTQWLTGRDLNAFFERATGIEPATFSLGIHGKGASRCCESLQNKVFRVSKAYPVVPPDTPRWGAKWGEWKRPSGLPCRLQVSLGRLLCLPLWRTPLSLCSRGAIQPLLDL